MNVNLRRQTHAQIINALYCGSRFGIRNQHGLLGPGNRRNRKSPKQFKGPGRFDDEIVPMTVQQLVTDKETGETSSVTVTLAKDEGNRPETTLASLGSRLSSTRHERTG